MKQLEHMPRIPRSLTRRLGGTQPVDLFPSDKQQAQLVGPFPLRHLTHFGTGKYAQSSRRWLASKTPYQGESMLEWSCLTDRASPSQVCSQRTYWTTTRIQAKEGGTSSRSLFSVLDNHKDFFSIVQPHGISFLAGWISSLRTCLAVEEAKAAPGAEKPSGQSAGRPATCPRVGWNSGNSVSLRPWSSWNYGVASGFKKSISREMGCALGKDGQGHFCE